VDLKIIGINYSDTNYRRGFRMHQAVSLPLTPGHEGAGVVSAVGEGVTGVRPGDRVVFSGQHRLGTYKQKMLLPAVSLVPVPADFGLKLAVAVLNQGQTAHYLCHDAYEVKAGDRVLVHAGAGGVGSNLVQMAKMLGAYVYATVSSDDKADVARDLGADKVIVYTKIDFAEEIMKDTEGKGVHAIFDAIGGDVLPKGLTCLARRGHLLTYARCAGLGVSQQSSGRRLFAPRRSDDPPGAGDFRLGQIGRAEGAHSQGIPARRGGAGASRSRQPHHGRQAAADSVVS
jgi:NADPH2:quinone reductase